MSKEGIYQFKVADSNHGTVRVQCPQEANG